MFLSSSLTVYTLRMEDIHVRLADILAVVEDDGAVRPAVVVDHTQVGEEADAHSLKTPLVTQGEGVALDLRGEPSR